ncbi:hypothetical protein A1O3_03328 [Capronia epimyces CBS 606.96]|uniref:Uncharacterized protein n=1 Tax=Capronia epimyces CBS 606.96 TaxID=1182542 RepID=W9Y0S3_9EURO|nr:uncharacterized protein A1O3_03328 [Capronia epimyces CBS 606.96]EXJ86377.1 hypothetical protein A1O3_03328 [Capronia epimyces CBS 606.96]
MKAGHTPSTDPCQEPGIFKCYIGHKQCVRHIGPPVESPWLDGPLAECPLRPVFSGSPVFLLHPPPLARRVETGEQSKQNLFEQATSWTRSSRSPPPVSPEHGPPPSLAEPLSDLLESRRLSLDHEVRGHELYGTPRYSTFVTSQYDEVALYGQQEPRASGWDPVFDPFVCGSLPADSFTEPGTGPPRGVIHSNQSLFAGTDQHVVGTGPPFAPVPSWMAEEVLLTTPPPSFLQDYISCPSARRCGHVPSIFHTAELEIMHHHLPFQRIPFETTMLASGNLSPEHLMMIPPSSSSGTNISVGNSNSNCPSPGSYKYYEVQNEELAQLVKDSAPLVPMNNPLRPASRLDIPWLQGLEG